MDRLRFAEKVRQLGGGEVANMAVEYHGPWHPKQCHPAAKLCFAAKSREATSPTRGDVEGWRNRVSRACGPKQEFGTEANSTAPDENSLSSFEPTSSCWSMFTYWFA